MMAQGYTKAETALQVLRETAGRGAIPWLWAAAGCPGAIDSRKTICGFLSAAVFFAAVYRQRSLRVRAQQTGPVPKAGRPTYF